MADRMFNEFNRDNWWYKSWILGLLVFNNRALPRCPTDSNLSWHQSSVPRREMSSDSENANSKYWIAIDLLDWHSEIQIYDVFFFLPNKYHLHWIGLMKRLWENLFLNWETMRATCQRSLKPSFTEQIGHLTIQIGGVPFCGHFNGLVGRLGLEGDSHKLLWCGHIWSSLHHFRSAKKKRNLSFHGHPSHANPSIVGINQSLWTWVEDHPSTWRQHINIPSNSYPWH